jgi:hypothetical protein
VAGDTFPAPVITRDTVAVETEALLATSRIPMLSIRTKCALGDKIASGISSQIHRPSEDDCQVQPDVEYLDVQSVTFSVLK